MWNNNLSTMIEFADYSKNIVEKLSRNLVMDEKIYIYRFNQIATLSPFHNMDIFTCQLLCRLMWFSNLYVNAQQLTEENLYVNACKSNLNRLYLNTQPAVLYTLYQFGLGWGLIPEIPCR